MQKRVLITRQIELAGEFINLLSINAVYPFILPMIETVPVDFKLNSTEYDYCIFSSVSAVKYFIKEINRLDIKHIVAVGNKTADTLSQYGINVDIVPEIFSAEGLKDIFVDNSLYSKKILIPGAEVRSSDLDLFLQNKGAFVDKPTTYKTIKIQYENNVVDDFIMENKINIVTFASPSAAESFLSYFFNPTNNCIKYVSIGKTTYNYLINRGIQSIYPEEFTVKGMIQKILSINLE